MVVSAAGSNQLDDAWEQYDKSVMGRVARGEMNVDIEEKFQWRTVRNKRLTKLPAQYKKLSKDNIVAAVSLPTEVPDIPQLVPGIGGR